MGRRIVKEGNERRGIGNQTGQSSTFRQGLERGVASPCLKQKKPAVCTPGKFGRISGDGKEETKGREGRGYGKGCAEAFLA